VRAGIAAAVAAAAVVAAAARAAGVEAGTAAVVGILIVSAAEYLCVPDAPTGVQEFVQAPDRRKRRTCHHLPIVFRSWGKIWPYYVYTFPFAGINEL
jgi:hypothetical protein